MKITAIRTTLVDVPMQRPIVSRIRVSDVITHLLVDLETDEGLIGHTYLVTFGHLMAASPTAYYLEHMPWAQPLLAEKLELVHGRVELPTRPGLGLVWDADAVKRWTVAA